MSSPVRAADGGLKLQMQEIVLAFVRSRLGMEHFFEGSMVGKWGSFSAR